MKYLLLSCLFLAGCNRVNLPEEQHLGGFRILGIKANTPEVSGSALPVAVQLTPVLSDMDGGGRAIVITGVSCLDYGTVPGGEPSCEGVPGRTDLTIPTFTPGAAAPNSQVFGSPSYTGGLPAITVTVPTGVLDSRSVVEQYNGVGYLVILKFTAGDQTISAYKRIVVSTRSTVNVNPDVTAVLGDGTSLAVLPTTVTNLTASVTGTTVYEYMDQSGALHTLTKEFQMAYFVTDGDLSRHSAHPSQNSIWIPPDPAPTGRPTTIVAVVYDGFGGMDFLVVDL